MGPWLRAQQADVGKREYGTPCVFGMADVGQIYGEDFAAAPSSRHQRTRVVALAETVTKLLRNMEYCGYGQTAGKVFNDLDACEQKFNQVGCSSVRRRR